MMLDKSLLDLSLRDIELHQEWYFPNDVTVESDEFVRPLSTHHANITYGPIISKSTFITNLGTIFTGIVQFMDSNEIYELQPRIILPSGDHIYFYLGMFEPSSSYVDLLKLHLTKSDFPIKYSSINTNCLNELYGIIEGFYQLIDGKIVVLQNII